MKLRIFLLVLFAPFIVFGQVYKSHTLQKDRLSIQLSEGELCIIPLSSKTVRIQWEKNGMKEQREFVLINKPAVPSFKLAETGSKLTLRTTGLVVDFDKQTGAIQYSDNSGKV